MSHRFPRLRLALAAAAAGTLLMPVFLEGCAGALQRELEVLLAFEAILGSPLMRESLLLRIITQLAG